MLLVRFRGVEIRLSLVFLVGVKGWVLCIAKWGFILVLNLDFGTKGFGGRGWDLDRKRR